VPCVNLIKGWDIEGEKDGIMPLSSSSNDTSFPCMSKLEGEAIGSRPTRLLINK
jgi:hypothetical protein